jgi:hypothetical protein
MKEADGTAEVAEANVTGDGDANEGCEKPTPTPPRKTGWPPRRSREEIIDKLFDGGDGCLSPCSFMCFFVSEFVWVKVRKGVRFYTGESTVHISWKNLSKI